MTAAATSIVVAPTNDTIYSAMASTLVQNGQQATGIVLDRLSFPAGHVP